MRLLTKIRRLIKDDRGAVAALAAVTITGMISFVGAGVDLGTWYSAHSELQNAVDAAARAGASNLIADNNGDGFVEGNYDGAYTKAVEYIESNDVDAKRLIWVDGQDLYEAGKWDFSAEDFASIGASSDPNDLDTVRVTMQRSVGTSFSRIFGLQSVNMSAVSAAYLGCAGSDGQGELPIAVRKAHLESLGPGVDIIFNSEISENCQWTTYTEKSCDPCTVKEFIQYPDRIPRVEVGQEVYINNGVIAFLFNYLADAYESNKDSQGNWQVKLPVVDWSTPQSSGTFVGYVNFTITEVKPGTGNPTDNKRVVGHWDDTTTVMADGATGGGECFGVRASRATLIN